MVMDDDEITFYIFYTKAFWELEDDTVQLLLLLALCILAFK
jgi:hypothetical protein